MTQLKDIQFTAPVLTGTVVNSGAIYRLEGDDVIEVENPNMSGYYYNLIAVDYDYCAWRFFGVADHAESAGCAGCAGYADCAGYAGFADCAGSAGYASSAATADCARYADSAGYADCAYSASSAGSAGYADCAGNASYACYAGQLSVEYGGCWSTRTIYSTELSNLPTGARILYYT